MKRIIIYLAVTFAITYALEIFIVVPLVIIAAEMLRRSRLRCCGVPRCAATR